MGIALSLCLLGTYLLSYYLAFIHDARFSGIGGRIGSCRTGDDMSYTGPFLPMDRASIRIHADFRAKTITKTITCRGLWVIYWPLVVIDINLIRPYHYRDSFW